MSKTQIQLLQDETMLKAKDQGCECPVCHQFVKIYRRKITSTMAYQLITLYRMATPTETWIHTRELVMGQTGIGDFSKLRFYGLIEEMTHKSGDEGKKTSGFWRITLKGIDFVKNTRQVPSHVLIFKNKALDFEGELVSIRDCLNNKFDYNELMAGA